MGEWKENKEIREGTFEMKRERNIQINISGLYRFRNSQQSTRKLNSTAY